MQKWTERVTALWYNYNTHYASANQEKFITFGIGWAYKIGHRKSYTFSKLDTNIITSNQEKIMTLDIG